MVLKKTTNEKALKEALSNSSEGNAWTSNEPLFDENVELLVSDEVLRSSTFYWEPTSKNEFAIH